MLGDVGAVPLGFLAAVFGIGGWRAGYWPPWFPVLVFLPFIADATVTLARRILSRAKVWQAHRDHYYQRLVCMGFGHRGTLVIYSALMAGTAISALAALIRAPDAGARVLALWIAALLLLYAGIGYHWNRGNKGLNESKC
jgi:UDP-N-acetylmuramyl pentapeptide phosphotransferase/UDP-N-acetylglucosamine-1-phosphate transferase